MEYLIIILSGIFGSVGAYLISINLNRGAVMGAAVMTLISGLIFPTLSAELGATLATVATTGAYAGMISQKNVPRALEMAIIGCIVGIISILATPVYAGVGGKLGTMAAISCFSWMGVKKVLNLGEKSQSFESVSEKMSND